MTKTSRLSFIRARAVALRFSSLASLGTVSTATPSASAHESVSPSPYRSAHVWKGAGKVEKGEALPADFTPAPVAPFTPAIDAAIDAEVAPIARVESLPEIGAHNLAHAVNCMLIALPWRG